MFVITEKQVAHYLDYPAAVAAMERVFVASAAGDTDNFPFVRERLRDREAVFGIKSGCDYASRQLGVKAGGYWMGNSASDHDRHQSTVLLLDIETGMPVALVAGNDLTAIRTAAASAAAAKQLSRTESEVLSVIGAGRQAAFQIEAMLAVRAIRQVRVWSPTARNVETLRSRLDPLAIEFIAAVSAEDAARGADIVVTVTPARAPVLRLRDLTPGVHVCAMGSDTVGKQELDVDIFEGARVFADDVEQASHIGECQHLKAAASPRLAEVTALGDVLRGVRQGRETAKEITVFDGTGLALQDIAAAHIVLERALAEGAPLSIAS